MIQLYNTLSGRLEPFVPLEDHKVKMYVCGPTVYGLLHIGNGRTFMTWDVVRRYLQYRGYEVTYVQNFTDVDDKIINRAQEEGLSAQEVTEKYIKAYFEDMEALGVQPADRYPRATETIPQMIAFIEGLIAKGFAYASGGDVYFRVHRFPDYGKLSRRDLEDQLKGARKEIDVEKKEDPLDFALWKGAKPGEPSWESPWGPGRPGWHIECSAMVREILGDTIDIHAGGVDLTFPHHENEIAQSEALTTKPFVKYWLHTGFLQMEAEKMSKSLGNIKTIRDVVAAYGQQPIRYFLLGTKYRKELDFSDDAIKAAANGLQGLCRTLAMWESSLALAHPDLDALVSESREAFEAAMDNDFNTAEVLGGFQKMATRLRRLANERPELVEGFGHVVAEIKREGAVLGLDLTAVEEEPEAVLDDSLSQDLLTLLIELRKEAKAAKQWAQADMIRDRLKALGIGLVDQKDGTTTWERLEKATV